MQYDRLFGSNAPPSDLLRRLLINKPFWDHSIVLFTLANNLNIICIDQTPQQPIPVQINPSQQTFFSAVENLSYRGKKEIHPLSSSYHSSSSDTTSINTCETALSSQLELPKHERTIKKYWVHPDNIVEIMLFLSSNKLVLQDETNNPSFTYPAIDEVGHPQGVKSKLVAMSSQSIHHVKGSLLKKEHDNRLKVTTTYMDTMDLNEYTERIIGKPIKTTRIRWFDQVENNKQKQQQQQEEEKDSYISLEQKVYYNGQQNHIYKGFKGLGKEPQQNYNPLEQHDWIQQRLWFKFKHFKPWLNGTWSISNVLDKPSCQYRADSIPTLTRHERNRMENTCLQMQDEIHNKIKSPSKNIIISLFIEREKGELIIPFLVLKTTQYRTVYISNDKKVTISIDTDITISRYSNKKDLIRFPYCIVQIEQDNSTLDQRPDWIYKLTSCPMLEPVHDFSLYLHGVGTLLYDQVHVFPSWFSKMEILNIRHTEYRGSLLFTEEKLAFLEEEQQQTTNISSSRSTSNASSDKPYWSSNTIASLGTCHTEDLIKYSLPYSSSSSSSSTSSSSSASSSLNHVPKQPGKLRRSFDSYCSFDHPTSSRSDPTNCKSCLGKLNKEKRVYVFKKKRNDEECVTFFSVLKEAFLWRYDRVGEKEPLLPVNEASIVRHQGYFMGYSRATVMTTGCVITSLMISYLLYMFILKIK